MRSARNSLLIAALVMAGFPQLCGGQEGAGDTQVIAAGQQRAEEVEPALPAPERSLEGESVVSTQRSKSPPPSPGCFFLNSRTFTIPFTVDAAGAQPTEVQLYTARGPTAKWRRIDDKPATAAVKEFQFTGQEDGEFWFATRTIDSRGHAHPAGPIRAQLKVFVDTGKPKATLEADADNSGRVDVVVSIDDSTPAAAHLRYVTDAVSRWRDIELSDLPSGKVQFTPPETWEQLSLQLIVTDSAKNRSVVSKLVKRPRLADSGNSRFAANRQGTGFGTNSAQYRMQSEPGQIYPRDISNSAIPIIRLDRHKPKKKPADAVVAHGYVPGSTGGVQSAFGTYRGAAMPAPETSTPLPMPPRQGTPARTRPFGPPSVFQANPALGHSLPPRTTRLAQNDLPPPATPQQISDGFGLDGPQQSAPQPETLPVPAGEKDPAKPRPKTAAEAMRPLAPMESPSSGRSSVESVPTPKAEVDPDRYQSRKAVDLSELTGLAPVRFSDSLRFSLDYELEAIGNAGTDAIELYGSTDGGKTWKFWGEDPDRVSPFDIQTKEEGAFGFRIVVVGANGLTSPRPLPEEAPDIVVVVDRSRPVVRISGAQYGEGDRTGSLVIRYQCNDANLAQRPIALSFSDRIDGPWTTIAAGLRNDGHYVWPADPGLPRKMFLRIDAKDRAENVGTYILERPIDSQGLAPRARIRGFQPLTEDAP